MFYIEKVYTFYFIITILATFLIKRSMAYGISI